MPRHLKHKKSNLRPTLRITDPPTYFAPPERASAEAVQADHEAFAGEAILQHVLTTLPELYVVLNEQRQIVFCNPALLELLGDLSLDAILGSRSGEALRCQHAGIMAAGCGTSEFCCECGVARAILIGQRGYDNTQECRISRTDGSALELRVRARPLQLGDRRYVLIAFHDISQEKRRRALENIFFHDILNTATGIVGIGEILHEGNPEEVAIVKDLVLALALCLVDEIRAQQTLVAAETGELTVRLTELNSLQVIEEVCSTYRMHKEGQGRTLAVTPDTVSVVYDSDPTLVRRVLGNMVKNALEATPAGGTVTVSCQAVGDDTVEFIVHNAAVMPRDVQQQIFHRSFSTKGQHRGLGTYSMKLLTERYLHGSIGFTSAPPDGTTFYARYPLHRAPH